MPLPVEKLAICPIVPELEAVKIALARTEVKEADAVNVLAITLVFAAGVCVAVVAAALLNPPLAISELNVVSVTAGVIVASVSPMKLKPTAVTAEAVTSI